MQEEEAGEERTEALKAVLDEMCRQIAELRARIEALEALPSVPEYIKKRRAATAMPATTYSL